MIKHHASATKLVILAGLILGFILSWGVFSGDQQGRVNILHLVIIYVLLPIVSLFFSTFSLLIGKNWNFAKVVSCIPLWSKSLQQEFIRLSQHKNAGILFFYRSQLAALSFSIASLIVLVLLLISSDVNFVWRSTVLDAKQIFPLLDWLATPWLFWTSAQPNIELLISTQDSRLLSNAMEKINFGGWWKFIFAAQLCYAFLLRFISIIICRLILFISNKELKSIYLMKSKASNNVEQKDVELSAVVNQIGSNYSLNNWCGVNAKILQEVEKKLKYSRVSELNAGPLATYSEQLVAERWQDTQLIIVKGWEPPLAELSDFMQNGKGYVLPLDWDANGMRKLNNTHLNEWRRFIFQLPNWQLLQLEEA